MTRQALAAELARLAGADSVRIGTARSEHAGTARSEEAGTAGSEYAGAGTPGNGVPVVAGVPALGVVTPPGIEEMAAVLAFCSGEGIPVEAAGACGWLGRGRPPAAPPLVVSTARIRGVVEHEPADLVVGVRAGTPLEELERTLRAHGQTLPLDPPAQPHSTVGAVAALGSAGPLQAAHGGPRDLLLGVDVVTGDGRFLRFGGRVVKNVAGYDGVRLLAGSRGSLGIVTGVYLLVRGAPDVDRTVRLQVGDPSAAAELAVAVRDAAAPDALEIMHECGSGVWTLSVRLRGSEEAVREAGARVRQLGHAEPRVVGAGPAGRAGPAGAGSAVAGSAGAPGSVDVPQPYGASESLAGLHFTCTAPPASLAVVLTAAERFAGHLPTAGGAPAVAAHAVNGVVRVWSSQDAVSAGSLRDAWAELRTAVANVGGTATCNVAPWAVEPPADAGESDAQGDAGALLIASRLRGAFDPAGIMMPGRDRVGR